MSNLMLHKTYNLPKDWPMLTCVLKAYVREFKIEISILKVMHLTYSIFQSQTFFLFYKKFLISNSVTCALRVMTCSHYVIF